MVLGWAPFEFWPIAIIGFAVLFYQVQHSSGIVHAGMLGGALGAGLHIVGHGWIYTALHAKTGLGMLEASMGSGIFFAYLSACIALPCMLFRWLVPIGSASLTNILGFASLLTLGEWVRSMLFNGFTSLSIGYSMIDTWLAGMLPIGGVYALGFVSYCIAGALTVAITKPASAKLALSMVAIVFLFGWALTQIVWTRPAGEPLKFRLIQVNVKQTEKFDPQHAANHAARLVDLINAVPADLIITPETAFTVFLNELPQGLVSRLSRFSENTNSHLFLGIATQSAGSDGYNSVLHFKPAAPNPTGLYSPNGIRCTLLY